MLVEHSTVTSVTQRGGLHTVNRLGILDKCSYFDDETREVTETKSHGVENFTEDEKENRLNSSQI